MTTCELRHPGILDPLNATDAANDPDGDGDSNYLEYLNGTDPLDPYNGLFPLQWSLLNPGAIQVDSVNDVWHAGRVNDVLSLGGGNILAATDHGGVWSVTRSYLAAPLSDNWDRPSVNALAAGVNGAGHFFAGGTGLYEADVTQFPPLYNWRELASPLAEIHKLIVLPGSRRIVVAGNGGLRWANIPNAGSPAGAYQWNSAPGLPLVQVSGLAVGPNESVLAAVNPFGSASPERGIYRGTWSGGQLLFAPATINGADVNGMFRTSLASCAGNLNYQYAISANSTGYVHTILRSADGGQTWNPCFNALFNGVTLLPWPALRGAALGQGNDRNNCIGVSPVNPNRVVFGWVKGPFLSADGGSTWIQGNANAHRHDDQTSVYFDPTDGTGNRFFVTSDGGIVLSSGFNADVNSSYNRNLANLEFLHGEPVVEWPGSLGVGDFNGLLVAGGLQDNGNVFTWLGGGYASWREYRGGDGGLHALLPSGTLLDKQSGEGNDVQLATDSDACPGEHRRDAGQLRQPRIFRGDRAHGSDRLRPILPGLLLFRHGARRLDRALLVICRRSFGHERHRQARPHPRTVRREGQLRVARPTRRPRDALLARQ